MERKFKYKLKENKDNILTEEYLKKSENLLNEFDKLIEQGNRCLERLKENGFKK